MNFYDPDPLRPTRERHEHLLREAEGERLAKTVLYSSPRRRRWTLGGLGLSLRPAARLLSRLRLDPDAPGIEAERAAPSVPR